MRKVWVIACLMIPWTLTQASTQAPFEFALLGDLPYGDTLGQPHPPYEKLVEDINTQTALQWVLHAGDIKSGGSPCSDQLYADRLAKLNAFDFPVILTPGDNEWTDCHREAAGAFVPLERLDTLRRTFYPELGKTLGKRPMMVGSQGARANFKPFRENVFWIHNQIVFVTIHLVGSANGEAPFDPQGKISRSREDEREVEERNRAALAWLNHAFAQAREVKAKGVFVMIHANPGLERIRNHRSAEELQRHTQKKAPFAKFLGQLENHIVDFAKPVVLAHGDSHYFRIDKPHLTSPRFLPNFTRVETFAAPNYHWLRIKVDPASREVFQFELEIVE